MITETLKYSEMPKGKKSFYLLRINDSAHLILEHYMKYKNGEWDNSVIYDFRVHSGNKEETLEEIKTFIPRGVTLYIEEGTFDEP